MKGLLRNGLRRGTILGWSYCFRSPLSNELLVKLGVLLGAVKFWILPTYLAAMRCLILPILWLESDTFLCEDSVPVS